MFIVEGNIGAGKSTFVECIKREVYGVQACTEPYKSWDSQDGEGSILEHFICSPQRWAYTMETFVMMRRVRAHLYDQSQPSPYVVERSIYSGHYVFACNGRKQGFMTDLEWSLYMMFFDYLIPEHCRAPKGFIYLRTSPETAFERVEKRSRNSENAITFEYLQQIHERHEEFLIEKKDVIADIVHVPVLVLDCDREFEADTAYRMQLLEQVVDFIGGLSSYAQNARVECEHVVQ